MGAGHRKTTFRAEKTRDYVHETIVEFEIPVEKDKNGDDETRCNTLFTSPARYCMSS